MTKSTTTTKSPVSPSKPRAKQPRFDFAADDESSRMLADLAATANPRAPALKVGTQPLANLLSDLSGGMIEADLLDGLDGYSWQDSRGNPRAVPLATEACCRLKLAIGNEEKEFDIRKPLPPAVAKWVRTIAMRLQRVADQIEAVEDARPRALIRRFVAGDRNVKFSSHDGLVDTSRMPAGRVGT